MMRGNRIFVPDYQRAYSWDTGKRENDLKKQVNTFLADLEDYLLSDVSTPYYFGHFLFEKTDDNVYAIIDGQQRLTTITIFISALFKFLEAEMKEEDYDIYEDLIKRRSTYRFSTVKYDDQLFRDYVIDKSKKDHYGIETTSGRRLVEAYDYFVDKIREIDIEKRKALLYAVSNASCTTHIVNGEAEAIQMFIFQNDRGKKPSHLVKSRFEHIYRSISSVEEFVDEDSVLTQTLKVYFNSLWETNSVEKINSELSKPSRIEFIKDFTHSLDPFTTK